MIDFVCVLFNAQDSSLPDYSKKAGYSTEWVDRLYRGISRQMPHSDWSLICLTDHQYRFKEPIKQVALDRPGLAWGSIMEAFRPDLTKKRRMILGLDTLIVGSLGDILSYDGHCGLLQDPYHKETICNGVGIFSHSMSEELWEDWTKNFSHWKKNALFMGQLSEMQFLRIKVGETCNLLDKIFPEQIQSYKVHWKRQRMNRENARIVYFHGSPKMHEIQDEELLKFWQ